MGSRFSIEQTTTALSARSRMTSSSYSFHPSTLSSTSTRCTGLAARPWASSPASSSAVRATPPPQPPSVNDGRSTSGRPSSAMVSWPSATEPTSLLRGVWSPARAQTSLTATRDSARRTASTVAPISSTPSRSRRSEEHTSELQSRPHLVCRLLLEKKKKHKNQHTLLQKKKKHKKKQNKTKT